jgi:putative ABC transport system ATP-binding protein
MPDTWFVRPAGTAGTAEAAPEGPLTAAELKARAADGRVTASTPVSPDGKEWVTAGEVEGLLPAQAATASERLALEMVGVAKSYGRDTPAVVRVDRFALRPGEQVVLAGPSGSGKTTLLNLIAGLLPPDAGTIRIDGTDITALSGAARDRFRGGRVGIVFQTFNLVQGLSAENNLLLAMMFGPLPASAHRARAAELLARVGLAEHAHKRPAQLSVGQQQRVAIARALANRPALVLADEPAANLDEPNARKAADLLKGVCREAGATLLVVAHDAVMRSAFDRVIDISTFKGVGSGESGVG